MAVVNGPALLAGSEPTRMAHDVLDAFLAGGSTAVSGKLGGGYNFVGIAPSIGLRAFVDFSGVTPLYWHQGNDARIFSTCATIIGALVDPGGWDMQAFGWLLAAGNLFGERMPSRGVSHLPPGYEAAVDWAGGKVALDRAPNWVWPEPAEDAGRDDLTSAEWDEVTHELVANFRAMKGLGTPVRLASAAARTRGSASLLSKAAGLEDVVSLRTNGPADSPEVECAAEVARVAGFPHERIGPPAAPATPVAEAPVEPEPFPSEQWWTRLHQHVYRFEGIVSPWDGLTGPIRRTTLNIRGIGGELYRRGNVKRVRHSRLTSTEELARLYADGSDRLEVLRPTEASFQADWRARWFEGRGRSGALRPAPGEVVRRPPAEPLERSAGAGDPGHDQRAPAPVVGRGAEEHGAVGGHPQQRPPALRGHAPDRARAARGADPQRRVGSRHRRHLAHPAPPRAVPVRLAPTTKVLARPKWDFLTVEAPAIDRLLRDANRHTDMGDLCNIRRLRRQLRRTEGFGEWKGKQIYSAIAIAIALLGRAEPVVDDCARL